MMMISNRLAGRTKSFLGRKAVSDRYLGDDGFRWTRDVMARPCCKGGVRRWRPITRTTSMNNNTVHASSSSSSSSSSSGKGSGWTYLQIDDKRNEKAIMLRETMVTVAKENIPLAMILWTLAELPVMAVPESPMGASPPASSYYVSLGLFLLTLPGENAYTNICFPSNCGMGCTLEVDYVVWMYTFSCTQYFAVQMSSTFINGFGRWIILRVCG